MGIIIIMFRLLAAAAAVSAVDVTDSVPDEEYVNVEEMSQYGYGLLMSLKGVVTGGNNFSSDVVTKVTIGDLINTFARTGYQFHWVLRALSKWGSNLYSAWRSTLWRVYYKNQPRRSYYATRRNYNNYRSYRRGRTYYYSRCR